jgi:DNA-binding transcriptional LysR family regulator
MPIGAKAFEGCRCVCYYIRIESQISGHAGSGGDAVVGCQADDDQALDSLIPQICLEGRADEGAVDPFVVDRFAVVGRGLGLRLAAAGPRPKEAYGVGRVMVHVNNRDGSLAPGLQQKCDTCFGARVVTCSPSHAVEAILHVDHDQRGFLAERFQFVSRCALTAAADFASSRAGIQNGDRVIGFTDGSQMTNDLEIRHCRVLVAVHDHGGVSSAARALGLAQSTVSETLLSLERLIGAPVTLRRRGHEAALTAAAEALLPHARGLISASEAALATVTMQTRGVIRLGAVESVSSFLLPGVVTEFRSRWPGVEVHVTIGLCDDLRKRVRRGELDAALTVEGSGSALVDEEGLSRVVSPTQLRLIVSSRVTGGAVTIKRPDLARRTLLLPDPDGAFNTLLRTWFEATRYRARFESAGSIDGVKSGVRSGDFVGVLPAYAVAQELATGSLLELKVQEPLPALALGLTIQRRPSEASPLHDMIQRLEKGFDRYAQVERASLAHRVLRR